MTRHPAVKFRPPLPVAVDAEAHLKIHGHEPVHVFYFPVAVRAVDSRPDVGAVVEFHMVGHIINANPGDRSFGFQVPSLLNDLGMLRDDVLVARETLAHRGNPRVVGPVHVGMTESAVDLLDPGVNPVAEKNGLLGADGLLGVEIIKVEHPREEEDQGRRGPYPVPAPFKLFDGLTHVSFQQTEFQLAPSDSPGTWNRREGGGKFSGKLRPASGRRAR